MHNNPIGIFDSGIGGLSVWQEIVTLLPHEATVYIGDSAHAPYGTRTADEIYDLTKQCIAFLLEQNVKLIVIACNAATVSCLEKIRADFRTIPIIGTVPVIKTAVEVTKNKKIGVLSTVRTAESHYQKHLIEEFALGCEVINIGTNELVPKIEKGDINSVEFNELLQKILQPFQETGIDTLALGCTHFPFIEQQIRNILGNGVLLLDSGAAVARQVQRVLGQNQTVGNQSLEPSKQYDFYTTGDAKHFETVAKKLVKREVSDKIRQAKAIKF